MLDSEEIQKKFKSILILFHLFGNVMGYVFNNKWLYNLYLVTNSIWNISDPTLFI